MTQAETILKPTGLDVIVAPAPFTPKATRLELPDLGQNVAQLLAAACNRGALDPDDLPRVRVYVNGVDLAASLGPTWLDYQPEAGDLVNVAVHPLGGGGQGGGNKALQTVLTIAVIALSLYVGGGAATPGMLDALWIRAGLAAAVQVGGTLAVNALFKPETAAAAQEANQRQALQGAGNGYRLRGPMPLRLGRQRVAFDMAAGSYSQLIGQDVWLKVMFGVHYGPCTVEQIKIGETLLADYPAEDVAVEYFLTPGERVSELYPGRVVQENFADELEGGVPEVHTTATDAERIEIDFAWPGGLYYTTDKGKRGQASAHILIEVQAVGGGSWQAAALPPASGPSGPLAPGSFYMQAATADTIRQTVSFAPPSKGQWNVRATLIPNGLGEGLNDRVGWTALRTLEAERPVVDETLAVIVLAIKSSDDLAGTLPVVSGIVTPICPVFDGGGWETEEPTSNAAALARWLLTGPAAATPLDASQVDDSIIDAFELIESNAWDTTAVDVVEEASQKDVLIRLGRAGRFSTYWNGQRLCFVVDWAKPVPRQVFTGRNAGGYRYRRAFPDPIHAVIVEFFPLDLTAPADEVIVYADGYDSSSAQLFETLRLDFSADKDRAFREGRAYLAKRELQVEVHEWQASLEAVATTYGDRVLVRHPSTLYGLADATVDHRIFSGGLVAGFKLDELVPFEAGRDYAVDFRRSDAVFRGVEIVNPGGPSRRVMFATPRPVDEAPIRDDLVVVGEVGQVTEDLEIVDVEASPDGTITFRGFRYIADALALAETGEIPEFTSGLKPRASPPVPRILAANGSPEGVDVAFDVDPVRSALVASFSVRWRISGTTEDGTPYAWRTLPPLAANARSFRTPPPPNATGELDETGEVHPSVEVDIEVRSVLRTGAVSAPGQALGVECVRGVPDVENLTATGLVRTSSDESTYPAIEVSAAPILDGVVQDLVVQYRLADDASSDWSAARSLPAAGPFGDLSPVRAGDSYEIRARWRTADNWVGEWSYAEADVPEGAWTSYAAKTVGGFTPAEFAAAMATLSELGADFLERFQEQIDRVDLFERVSADGIIANALRHVEERAKLGQVAYLPGGVPVNVGLQTETSLRVEGDEVIAESVSVVAAATASAAAAVVTEQTARISADSALSSTVSSLAATVTSGDSTNAAAIVAEQTARANADSALSSSISSLSATVGSNTSAITAEATTRANADSATAATIALLGAKNGAGTAFVLNGGTAYVDGSTSFSSYISGVSSTLSSHSGSIAAVPGQIDSALNSAYSYTNSEVAEEITARSGADSALASSISSVSSTVGSHTASITTLAESLNGVRARYGVVVNGGGRLAAFQLLSGEGESSSFLIQADEFGVSDGSTTSFPFSISGGVVRMTAVEVDTLKANIVDAANLKINSTASMTATTGDYGLGAGHGGGGAQVCQITVYCTGGKILVNGSYSAKMTAGPGEIEATGGLFRGGSSIQGARSYAKRDYSYSLPFTFLDDPGEGYVTYTLYDTVGGGATIAFGAYGLTATEIRRTD